MEKENDLHSAFVTLLMLSGENFDKTDNRYDVFQNLHTNILSVQIFQNSFNIYFKSESIPWLEYLSFTNEVLKNLQLTGLKAKNTIRNDFINVYEITGDFDKLLDGLVYVEKVVKNNL